MIALVVTARVALVSLAALALAALSVLPVAAAARTDDAAPGVDLSRDLSSWSADLDDPMFLPGLPWEPGDSRSSTFFVRNDTDDEADVDVTLTRAPAQQPATDDYVTMVVETRETGATALEPDASRHVVRLRDLDPAEAVAVTLRAEVSPGAPVGVVVDADVIDVRAALASTDRSDGVLATAHLQLAPLFLGFALVGASVVTSWRRGRGNRA